MMRTGRSAPAPDSESGRGDGSDYSVDGECLSSLKSRTAWSVAVVERPARCVGELGASAPVQHDGHAGDPEEQETSEHERSRDLGVWAAGLACQSVSSRVLQLHDVGP